MVVDDIIEEHRLARALKIPWGFHHSVDNFPDSILPAHGSYLAYAIPPGRLARAL